MVDEETDVHVLEVASVCASSLPLILQEIFLKKVSFLFFHIHQLHRLDVKDREEFRRSTTITSLLPAQKLLKSLQNLFMYPTDRQSKVDSTASFDDPDPITLTVITG